jgi:hypothetical protein
MIQNDDSSETEQALAEQKKRAKEKGRLKSAEKRLVINIVHRDWRILESIDATAI